MATNQNNYRAFSKGMAELRAKDVPAVRTEIMGALGVATRQSFHAYATGRRVNLDVEKARRIESIFAAYGVTDCWGKA